MFDLNSNIVDVFCSWVKDRPEHTAIIEGDNRISFAELYHSAKALAARLAACGAGKGDVVPIIGKRDSCFIEELLSVMMTGAAFASVDESFPKERQNAICGQVNARIILKDRAILDANEWLAGRSRAAAETGVADSFEIPQILPDDPAYVHFTSGTEGVPKGVKVPHRGSVLRTFWAIKDLGNDENDVMLVKTNLPFVASIVEITRGLMTGGTMVILPQSEEKEPSKILRAISDHKVTWMNMSPSMLLFVVSEAVRSGRMDMLDSLRLVECAGEALRPSPAKKILEALKHARLINAYGQTETATVLSTWHEVTADDVENEVIPIGIPPEGVDIYVIADGKLCGTDEPGEICVGAGGISQGYIDDELTKKSFIVHKFEDGTEKLLYHTGDRGQWRSDGVLLGLGRRDSMVKIRGQRVELGDVESGLSSLPDVKECTVIAVKNKKSDSAICAYVVTHSGESSSSAVREELSKKLPEYMLPAYIVFMDELPRGVTGKVDRTRLPKPQNARTTRYEPPRSDLEAKICKAFEETLEAESVGIHDSFYELGGDSLSAISLHTMLESSLGKEAMEGVQVSEMVRAQTPENIAELLSGGKELCWFGAVDKTREDSQDREMLEHLLSLRSPGSGPCKRVEPTASNRIMLRRPTHITDTVIVFDKSVGLEEARRAASQVMRDTVYEYAYDESEGCYMQYPGVRDEIPVFDFSQEEAESLQLALSRKLFAFDGSQLLADMFMTVNDKTGAPQLFMVTQHSLTDRESGSILIAKISAVLSGKKSSARHAVYTIPVETEKETVSADEYFRLVDELDSRVKDHPYTRKAVGRELEPESFNDPIPVIMDMYLELNPLLADMKKVPIALIVNGRNAENADTLGCCLTFRYSVYDTETRTMTEAPEVQPEEDVEKRTEWAPLINYIGVYTDSRPREEVYTIQKGYEKAKYLHGSRLGNELVLKLPIYE